MAACQSTEGMSPQPSARVRTSSQGPTRQRRGGMMIRMTLVKSAEAGPSRCQAGPVGAGVVPGGAHKDLISQQVSEAGRDRPRRWASWRPAGRSVSIKGPQGLSALDVVADLMMKDLEVEVGLESSDFMWRSFPAGGRERRLVRKRRGGQCLMSCLMHSWTPRHPPARDIGWSPSVGLHRCPSRGLDHGSGLADCVPGKKAAPWALQPEAPSAEDRANG